MDPVNLDANLALVNEHWKPRIVAQVNDFNVKIVKLQGEFVWHDHPDDDELFLVLDGELTVEMGEGEVRLHPGELFVVPRGVEHRPVAERETSILLLERASVVNTGGVDSDLRTDAEWI